VLEEYGPELRYSKGEHNIFADALSRLDMVPEPREQGKQMDDDEIATLFATDEDDYPIKFPLSYQEIENRQKVDEEIKKLLHEKSEQYKQTRFDFGDTQYSLVTRNGKIVVPKALQKSGVKWYHECQMVHFYTVFHSKLNIAQILTNHLQQLLTVKWYISIRCFILSLI
jgi:hypothetical protein